MGESAALRRAIGHQSSGARAERRQRRARRRHTSSRWLSDNESEGVYVRAVMENLPTLAKTTRPKGERQAPKRGRSWGHTIMRCMVSTRKETRCKAQS